MSHPKNFWAILLLASVFLFSTWSPSIFTSVQAVSESSVISPDIQDAYVDENVPTTNFNVSTLLVRSSTYPLGNARSYLGFDLSVIPPAAIISARLKVYVTRPPSVPRKYEVYVVHGSWNESEITWSSQPWIGFRCSVVRVNTTQGWVSFDVTQAVRGYVNRWYAVEGFIIRDEAEYDMKGTIRTEFASKEYPDEALRPILNVTVSYDPIFQMATWPDQQTIYPGGSIDFWSDVRSLNLFEGDVTMNVSGLHPTMSASIQPQSFHLSAGDVRGVRITIGTSAYTPATSYTITITARSGEIEQSVTVRLEVKAALLLRDLPSNAANNTDITVALIYNEGIIDATGLVVKEWLPRFVDYVSHQMPSVGITSFNSSRTSDGRTLLQWILANRTGFSTFRLNYTAHFAVPSGEGMPGDLMFWGTYGAIDSTGQNYWENILGDQRVEITFGLPGPWDDDGRVNDWELLQAMSLWTQGEMSDLELLAYIDLWSRTWWL